MTDLESFIDLYRRLGVECALCPEGKYQVIKLLYKTNFTTSLVVAVIPFFDGYSGFYTAIHFNEDGKFVKQEFLE